MAAAPTVKRVTQELGGKSANIILDDADFENAVKHGAQECFRNTGQSCNAPTRMLVPRSKMAEAEIVAKQTAEATNVGDPFSKETGTGPLASKAQFDKVQRLIQQGMAEGAQIGGWRPRAAGGHSQRVLCEAYGVRRRPQRHDDRARGNLRPRSMHHPVRDRR